MPSIAKNLKWTSVSQGGRLIIQILSVVVTARLLDPSDFGLITIVLTIMTFAYMFRDMGTGVAIIQKESLDPELVNAIYWLNVLMGGALMMLILALSIPLARLFNAPPAAILIAVTSPIFVLSSISIVQKSLMERDESFDTLAKQELLASFAGFVVAVIAAVTGLGVYALVLQLYVSIGLMTLTIWLSSRWRPRLPMRLDRLRSILSFSTDLLVFQLVNYVYRNFDTFIISRFLGTGDLGIYSVANRVVFMPLQNLASVLSRSMMPSYSRSQREKAEVAQHYGRLLGYLAALFAPPMVAIWLYRAPLVELALGDDWTAVASVLTWVIPAGFIQMLLSTTGTVFISQGNTKALRNISLISTPIMLAALTVGAHWGLSGVALAFMLVTLMMLIPVMTLIAMTLDTTVLTLIRPLRRAVIPSFAVMVVSFLLAGEWFRSLGGSAATLLQIALAAAAGMAVSYRLVFRHHLFGRSV